MAKSLILLSYNLNLLYLGLKMLDRGPKLKKNKVVCLCEILCRVMTKKQKNSAALWWRNVILCI